MSGYSFYQPQNANPNDGELITLCKILERLSGSTALGTGALAVQDHNSGSNGGAIVASTSSATGSFYAIQFVTSGTLTAYTGNITGTVTGVTFPAGFVLYGTVTAFTTGSGTSVVAYSV
jgi:hypothetical protein